MSVGRLFLFAISIQRFIGYLRVRNSGFGVIGSNKLTIHSIHETAIVDNPM